MDNKLKALKEQFETSIPTSFTEQNKQAVMNQIKKSQPSPRRNLLPKALSVVAFAVACLFIFFIFSNDQFQFFGSTGHSNDDSGNEDAVAMNDSDDFDEPDIAGYIMDIEEDSILVISNEPMDFSANGGVAEFYSAIYFSSVPDDVEVGQYVQVWAKDGVAESYPGQAEVGTLEVVETEQPEGAQLTEAEAIQRAIEYGEETGEIKHHMIAIRDIDFHESGFWSIEFFDTEKDSTFQIDIQDQQ